MRKRNKFIPYIISTPDQHHREQRLKHNVSHQQEYFNVNTEREATHSTSINYLQNTYQSPFSSQDEYRVQDKPDEAMFQHRSSFPLRPIPISSNDATIDDLASVEEVHSDKSIEIPFHHSDEPREEWLDIETIREIEIAIDLATHSDPDDDEDFIMYPDNTEYDADDFNNQMNHEFGNQFSDMAHSDMDTPMSAEELNNQMMHMEGSFGFYEQEGPEDMLHESSLWDAPQELHQEELFDDPFDMFGPMF